MMPLQNVKTVSVIKPQSVATNATATGVIDRLGYDEVAINVHLDTAAATSSNPAVLKVGEGDTSTAFTDITALVGDGQGGFTIPAADTSAPQIIRLNLDARARKRYLQVSLTSAGAAQLAGVTADLNKADDTTVARAGMALVANA